MVNFEFRRENLKIFGWWFLGDSGKGEDQQDDDSDTSHISIQRLDPKLL